MVENGRAAVEVMLPVRWVEANGCVAAVFNEMLAARRVKAEGYDAAILEVMAAGGLAPASGCWRIHWGRSHLVKD